MNRTYATSKITCQVRERTISLLVVRFPFSVPLQSPCTDEGSVRFRHRVDCSLYLVGHYVPVLLLVLGCVIRKLIGRKQAVLGAARGLPHGKTNLRRCSAGRNRVERCELLLLGSSVGDLGYQNLDNLHGRAIVPYPHRPHSG